MQEFYSKHLKLSQTLFAKLILHVKDLKIYVRLIRNKMCKINSLFKTNFKIQSLQLNDINKLPRYYYYLNNSE